MTAETTSIVKDFNYDTVSLVWLDSQASHLPEYVNHQEKLRHIINYLKLYDNLDQCEQYLRSLSNCDRVTLIVNDQFAQEISSRIHSLRQIASIYVYGVDKPADEQWIQQYSKIRSMVLQFDELLTKLQSDQNPPKLDDSPGISIYKNDNHHEQISIESTNQFIYFHLLMDCLPRIKINLADRTPLISLCREIYKGNTMQLHHIEELEQTYLSNQAVSWYMKDTFLSRILNKALYMQNIDLLFLFRFFLRDIQRQLEQSQYSSAVRLYRSVVMSNEELQLFQDAAGGFISINTFFRTEFNRQQALSDFDPIILPDNLQRVLFEVDADPRLDNIKPFSMINPLEMLFMAGSIFRVVNTHRHDDHVWLIQMTLASSNDEHLISNFTSTKRKIGYDKRHVNQLTFGNLLWKMNKLDQAERYYLYMINSSANDDLSLADLYYNLGHIYSDKNEYDSSLQWYNRSLAIWKLILKPTDPDLANTYNAIATNHWKKDDYQQALDAFNKALDISKQAYGEDHISVAMCLNNMATVMSHEKDYSKALSYYLKALTLFQKYLPTNHLNLASLHCNISTIYKNLEQIDFALEHLNLSLKIYETSLPLQHPNIVMMLKNIAFLYEQKREYPQAVNYYEKISTIYHQTLPSTDPVIIQNEEKIQYLSSL